MRCRLIAAADVVFATAISEPSPQDLTRPSTRAERVDEGWRIDGHKVFATMAPAATMINVGVTYQDDNGDDRYGFALVPASAPGVFIPHDWDALGMRASESGSVSFHDVRIGADALRYGFPAGCYSAAMFDRFLASGAFHAAASLGIAESAHARIVDSLRRRSRDNARRPARHDAAGREHVDIATMRAVSIAPVG